METDLFRISQLAKKRDNPNPSQRRLPVVKVGMDDYTSEDMIRRIITQYQKKIAKNQTQTTKTITKKTTNQKTTIPNEQPPKPANLETYLNPCIKPTTFKAPSKSILTLEKPEATETTKTISLTPSTQLSNRLTLIIGHGRSHPYYTYLPYPALMLDINPVASPDILGDMLNKKFMDRFPSHYFQDIILMYTPPPHPFHARNKNIWTNLHHLLKTGGMIKSFYMYKVFLRRLSQLDKTKIAEHLREIGPTNLFQIELTNNMITMKSK